MTVLFALSVYLNFEGLPLNHAIREFCSERLERDVPVPAEAISPAERQKSAIYVLGGAQGSLEDRFEVAARLYRSGAAGKVFILSRPGITVYDATLGRNPTNDEWSLKELTGLGVSKKDIEIISLANGPFGTLREAKEVPQAASQAGYKALILVTSNYHTERVWRTFKSSPASEGLRLYIYSSKDSVTLIWILGEYLKLLIYEAVLI